MKLTSQFATELPELSVAWQAAEVASPQLLALNEDVAVDLGLDPAWLRTDDGIRFLVGNLVPDGATPVAQAYAGHQFGGFSPRLGDGRALLLGEVTDDAGRLRDVHLKGSGRTPFSRGGDGLAAVGPMLREYLIGEAMHGLGIPTTRALAVVGTGTRVQREEGALPGAVLARVASSHLRVGSFQFARATDDAALLRRLADHAIARHHPEAADAANPALALMESVVRVQAELIAQWMLVGFIHGVMNTDNMTISGETIDYGPCAFMDAFDPATVFSSIDTMGRYAWGAQPVVAEWNLARFAEALLPLIEESEERAVELAVDSLGGFRTTYSAAWATGLRTKLGLADDVGDDELLTELLDLMKESRVDMTTFFRALGEAARGDVEPARSLVLDLAKVDAWLARWRALGPDPARMDAANPIYLPRNHLVEEALDAAVVGDLEPFQQLVELVRAPFTLVPGRERYTEPGPERFTSTFQTFCGT